LLKIKEKADLRSKRVGLVKTGGFGVKMRSHKRGEIGWGFDENGRGLVKKGSLW
jgi:hypothetical protein